MCEKRAITNMWCVMIVELNKPVWFSHSFYVCMLLYIYSITIFNKMFWIEWKKHRRVCVSRVSHIKFFRAAERKPRMFNAFSEIRIRCSKSCGRIFKLNSHWSCSLGSNDDISSSIQGCLAPNVPAKSSHGSRWVGNCVATTRVTFGHPVTFCVCHGLESEKWDEIIGLCVPNTIKKNSCHPSHVSKCDDRKPW